MSTRQPRLETLVALSVHVHVAIVVIALLVSAGCLATIPDVKAPAQPPAPISVAITNAPVPAPASGSEASNLGPLIDPPFNPVTASRGPDYEEVGIEQTYKIIFRGHTWVPSLNGWWSLTTPFVGHVRRVGNDVICDQDFVFNGATWHCRGWSAEAPKKGQPTPRIDIAGPAAPWGTKHAIWEVRARP